MPLSAYVRGRQVIRQPVARWQQVVKDLGN